MTQGYAGQPQQDAGLAYCKERAAGLSSRHYTVFQTVCRFSRTSQDFTGHRRGKKKGVKSEVVLLIIVAAVSDRRVEAGGTRTRTGACPSGRRVLAVSSSDGKSPSSLCVMRWRVT